jgi:hypothetical protein
VQYVMLHVLSSELYYSFAILDNMRVQFISKQRKATFNHTPQHIWFIVTLCMHYLYRQDKVVCHIGRSRKHMVQDQIIQSRL